MTDEAKSTVALVFFITYVLFQPPATVLCRKIGAALFLRRLTQAYRDRTSPLFGRNMLRLGCCNGKIVPSKADARSEC